MLLLRNENQNVGCLGLVCRKKHVHNQARLYFQYASRRHRGHGEESL